MFRPNRSPYFKQPPPPALRVTAIIPGSGDFMSAMAQSQSTSFGGTQAASNDGSGSGSKIKLLSSTSRTCCTYAVPSYGGGSGSRLVTGGHGRALADGVVPLVVADVVVPLALHADSSPAIQAAETRNRFIGSPETVMVRNFMTNRTATGPDHVSQRAAAAVGADQGAGEVVARY